MDKFKIAFIIAWIIIAILISYYAIANFTYVPINRNSNNNEYYATLIVKDYKTGKILVEQKDPLTKNFLMLVKYIVSGYSISDSVASQTIVLTTGVDYSMRTLTTYAFSLTNIILLAPNNTFNAYAGQSMNPRTMLLGIINSTSNVPNAYYQQNHYVLAYNGITYSDNGTESSNVYISVAYTNITMVNNIPYFNITFYTPALSPSTGSIYGFKLYAFVNAYQVSKNANGQYVLFLVAQLELRIATDILSTALSQGNQYVVIYSFHI